MGESLINTCYRNKSQLSADFCRKFADICEICFWYYHLMQSGTARHSGEWVDCSGCSSLSKEENDNSWIIRGSFPLEIFNRDPRILFGLELLEYVDGKERNLVYPPGNYTDDLRLNLGYFTPDRTVVLELQ